MEVWIDFWREISNSPGSSSRSYSVGDKSLHSIDHCSILCVNYWCFLRLELLKLSTELGYRHLPLWFTNSVEYRNRTDGVCTIRSSAENLRLSQANIIIYTYGKRPTLYRWYLFIKKSQVDFLLRFLDLNRADFCAFGSI